MNTIDVPDWLRALFPWTGAWFTHADGVRQHYLLEGPAEAETVVFVHGNPTWSFMWRDLLTALTPERRVLAVDHVGMGLSDKPVRYAYTLDQHITNLERLLDGLGIARCSLVMHDWGGAIGMGYATRHPERIDKLVALNTAAFPAPWIPLRIACCRWPLVGGLAVRGFNAFALAAGYMTTVRPLDPAVRRALKWPYRDWASRRAIHAFVRDIPMRENHPTMPVLKAIDAGLSQLASKPLAIGWGMRDWCFTPRFLDLWRERFPAATVWEYPEAAHLVLEDAGDDLIPRIREFLTSST